MGNIVILVGSMRKGGNTDLLAQAFAEGARENNFVEIVSVADYKVNPCIGCNSCFTREGNKCFQNDDMDGIYEKLKVADMVVVASPVYFYGISAELKAVIDRLHTPMRNEFSIKKLALLLVGAAELPELFDAIKLQYQLVLNFFHLEDLGMVLVRGVKDKGDIKGNAALKEAYDLGISDFVLFLGMVEDTAPILQAMDVFVFTSVFEGLGMALIEAQASGLRCVCSDVVPKETKVTGLIQYLSLNESPVKWAEIISLIDFDNRTDVSEEAYKSITAAGYNINIEAYKLRKIYLDNK